MTNEITFNEGASILTSTPDLAHPYNVQLKDTFMALIALAFGFLFIEWYVIMPFAPTLSVFIFLISIIVTTGVYMCVARDKTAPKASRWKGYLLLSLALVSSSFFIIFDNTPLNSFMLIFTMFLIAAWVMTVNNTSITDKLSGFIIGDLINQVFVIPFNNFPALFMPFILRKKEEKSHSLSLIVGIIISIPIIIAVVTLLSQAGTGFDALVDKALDKIYDLSFMHYAIELLFAIPIACYFFGFIYGNHRKRKTEIITYENTNSTFVKFHAITPAAIYGPMAILNVIYIAFFVTMANYFLSAFSGKLPMSMTYAEYARQGFFELCAVAAINLTVIVFAYTCLKREEAVYPKVLKALSGFLSLFTIALILTAMSKMLMYISSCGLTRLRLYTFWFMILLLFAFIVISIWHIKKFNLGKPIIIGFVVLFLALSFSNSDGIIAKYNIQAHEKGQIKSLDTYHLTDLSAAVVPYVSDYAKRTKDAEMKDELVDVLSYYKDLDDKDADKVRYRGDVMSFNFQSIY